MVITNVNQVVYQGDGVTTAFPFTFRIIDATDIKLLLLDSDGTETDITSDYFVDTENDTVHYPGYAPGAEPALSDRPPVLAEGQKLVIYRKLPITQEKDLGDKWPFNVIELGLDKLTMILQDIWDWLGRCLYVSKGQAYEAGDAFDPTIPLEAGKVICGNENGTGFEAREALMEVNGAWDGKGRQIHSVADPTGDQDAVTKKYADTRMDNNFMKLRPDGTAWEARNLPISNVAGPALVRDAANKDYVDRILAGYSGQGDRFVFFDNVAQMQAAELVPSQMAVTLGYHDVNDGGAGVYTIRDIGADTPDGGSIIEIPGTSYVAELITDGEVNIRQFGAVGDGVTDDSVPIINAINFAKRIYIPDGTYMFSQELDIPDGKYIYGNNANSVLLYTGTDRAIVLKGCFCTFRNFILKADTDVVSANKIGFSMNRLHGSPKTITNVIINGMEINRFDFAGIDLHTVWQLEIENTKIRGNVPQRTTPASYYGIHFDKDPSAPTWSCSGLVFKDLYINYCSYGIYIQGAWGLTVQNCIFEYNYKPMYRDIYGLSVFVDSCWFEANTHDEIDTYAGMFIWAGRNIGVNELNNSGYVKEGAGVTNWWRNGNSTTRIGINKDGIYLSGNAPNVKTSTFVRGVSLDGYSSYADSNAQGNSEYMSSQLALGAGGDAYGNGRTWGELVFSSGVVGAGGSTPLRPVFKINRYGAITPEDAGSNTNIGASDKMYNMGYFKNITLLGNDGNNYKISVDSGGNLVATQVTP